MHLQKYIIISLGLLGYMKRLPTFNGLNNLFAKNLPENYPSRMANRQSGLMVLRLPGILQVSHL
jgi:hypothetical protein